MGSTGCRAYSALFGRPCRTTTGSSFIARSFALHAVECINDKSDGFFDELLPHVKKHPEAYAGDDNVLAEHRKQIAIWEELAARMICMRADGEKRLKELSPMSTEDTAYVNKVGTISTACADAIKRLEGKAEAKKDDEDDEDEGGDLQQHRAHRARLRYHLDELDLERQVLPAEGVVQVQHHAVVLLLRVVLLRLVVLLAARRRHPKQCRRRPLPPSEALALAAQAALASFPAINGAARPGAILALNGVPILIGAVAWHLRAVLR
mgnify:CR=1 FL=1